MKKEGRDNIDTLVSFFLRIGLSSAFLYAAFATFLDPLVWIGFLPTWIPLGKFKFVLLFGFSVYEIALSLWLLSGRKLVYSSGLAALTLLGIILFNLAALDIVFRDVPIFFAAVALIIVGYQKNGWT